MAINLFSQILKFTKYSIELIEKLSRRHLINFFDVFVMKGFTVQNISYCKTYQRQNIKKSPLSEKNSAQIGSKIIFTSKKLIQYFFNSRIFCSQFEQL